METQINLYIADLALCPEAVGYFHMGGKRSIKDAEWRLSGACVY